MAKTDRDAGAVTRADVLRSRGLYQIKEYKGKVITQKWPRQRGPKKSARQQAWVDRFTCLAMALKSPFPQILDEAKDATKGTGWYYRDAMERAAAGLWMQYRDEPPVRTPTAFVSRVAQQNISQNVLTAIVPDTKTFDNNAFWENVIHPTRLTIRSPGLYIFGCQMNYGSGTNGQPVSMIKRNGTEELAVQYTGPAGNFQTMNLMGFNYFHDLDYIEALSVENSSPVWVKLNSFWILAISPETLVP